MARGSNSKIALLVALALGIGIVVAISITAVRQGDISGSATTTTPTVKPETAAQHGVFAAEDPETLLAKGRLPGLPEPADRPIRRVAAAPQQMEPPELFEQAPLSEMLWQFETLPDVQRARAAHAISRRLFECMANEPVDESELLHRAEQAYMERIENHERMLEVMQPSTVLRLVDQMEHQDALAWMQDWTERRIRLQALCDEDSWRSPAERAREAQRWLARAAELGDLDAMFMYLTTVFISVASGQASELVERKQQVLEMIDQMLEARFAPVLAVLAGYADYGIFHQPDPDLRRAYNLAFLYVVSNPAETAWRMHDWPQSDVQQWVSGLAAEHAVSQRVMDPQRLARIERWAGAIVAWPERQQQ